MGGQQYKPPETPEEIKARLAKREAEAERRDAYLLGNYQREHLNGTSNTRTIDWANMPRSLIGR
jgi:hypothetical protein